MAGQLLVKQVENYTDYEKRMILAKKFIEAAADNIYRNFKEHSLFRRYAEGSLGVKKWLIRQML